MTCFYLFLKIENQGTLGAPLKGSAHVSFDFVHDSYSCELAHLSYRTLVR